MAFELNPGAPGLVLHTRTQRVPDPTLPDSEPQYLRIAGLGYWDVYAARCTDDRDPIRYRSRIR